jgi:hypothetical protein
MWDRPPDRRLDAQTTQAYRAARILRTFKSGNSKARASEAQRVSTIVDPKLLPPPALVL